WNPGVPAAFHIRSHPARIFSFFSFVLAFSFRFQTAAFYFQTAQRSAYFVFTVPLPQRKAE
ncbi:hypothetical protein ACRQEE_04865, partial [Actinotignum sp. GS-2025c]|uniref:hypothetical protein n=1 Tax=Actinotignum sp. GS-2025c TaxID=3427276 RepID=UPI003F46F89E